MRTRRSGRPRKQRQKSRLNFSRRRISHPVRAPACLSGAYQRKEGPRSNDSSACQPLTTWQRLESWWRPASSRYAHATFPTEPGSTYLAGTEERQSHNPNYADDSACHCRDEIPLISSEHTCIFGRCDLPRPRSFVNRWALLAAGGERSRIDCDNLPGSGQIERAAGCS